MNYRTWQENYRQDFFSLSDYFQIVWVLIEINSCGTVERLIFIVKALWVSKYSPSKNFELFADEWVKCLKWKMELCINKDHLKLD